MRGRYALRAAIGNVRTERRHLEAFLEAFRAAVGGRALTAVRRSGNPFAEKYDPMPETNAPSDIVLGESELLMEPLNKSADLSALRIDRADEPSLRGASSGPASRPLCVAAVGASCSFSPARRGVALRPPEVATTRVALVTPTQASTVLTASGYIVARSKAEISPKSVGRIAWLNLEEGQKVKKGELVARLESQELEAQKRQYVAARDQVVAQLENARLDRDARQVAPRREDRLAAGVRRRRRAGARPRRAGRRPPSSRSSTPTS